jgi:hypothetical protein
MLMVEPSRATRPAPKKEAVNKIAAPKAVKPKAVKPNAKDAEKTPKTKKTTPSKATETKASMPANETVGKKMKKQAGKNTAKHAKPATQAQGTPVAPQADKPRVKPEKAPKKAVAPKSASKETAAAKQPAAAAKPAAAKPDAPKPGKSVSPPRAVPKASITTPKTTTPKAATLKAVAQNSAAPKIVVPTFSKPQAAKIASQAAPSASAVPSAQAAARKAAPQDAPATSRDPESTGRSRMVLMARDPKWLCAYWELDPEDVERHRIGALVGAPLLLVRLNQEGGPAQDFTVLGDARTWYIPTQDARGAFRAELGYIGQSGAFVSVAVSSRLDLAPTMPATDSVAARGDGIDGESAGWATQVVEGGPGPVSASAPRAAAEPLFARPDRHAGGASEQQPSRADARALGGASEALLFVEVPGGASEAPNLARLLKLAERGRGFWMLAATELIVYGATEPDARVTIAGEPVALRPDGTFTVRYALPDGRLEIPVRAASADGAQTREIASSVEKRTA